jgi:hypothetical protein
MSIFRDGYGSSMHTVPDGPEILRRVDVPCHRLEEYASTHGIPAPQVVKIDSQGAERAILDGSGQFLTSAKVLIIETWLDRRYGPNTPLLGEIVELLRLRGFSLVEFGERFYDAQHRLYSVDAFFFAESFLANRTSDALSRRIDTLTGHRGAAGDRIIENAELRARLSSLIAPEDAGPIDVVITANEINDRHGTGLLLKRILDGGRMMSICSRNDWGVQDFGRWNATISQREASRAQSFRNVLRVLAGREIGNAFCVPYLPDEVATAIAVKEAFGARLCAYIMDDQNVSAGGIADRSMREFLEKSSVRFATHPELEAAYEKKYGLKFFLLPAVVPDELIAREALPSVPPGARATMIGSIWDQTWLDDLCAALNGSRWQIDWFGNNRFWSVDFSEAKLRGAGIVPHGVIPETRLAGELRKYPFAIVPVAASETGDANRGELRLSLPGRILFTLATSQTPMLIVGSERSSAARFVQHFGIGMVAPYQALEISAAMERLSDPGVQNEMRKRAAAIGPAFSDRGVKEWLRSSIELGRAADGRFEDAFAGYTG